MREDLILSSTRGLEDWKMPSSPLSRRSPARELKVESAQRRGHGLGTGYPLKAKDDDLLLFSEVQNRERDNSLLYSDDFDESLCMSLFGPWIFYLNILFLYHSSLFFFFYWFINCFFHTWSAKLRYFSNINLGIMIPTRAESNDLLNADGDKNDYDW